jgi:uncharacterized membrane protein
MSKGRLETFSDAVIAIVITIMVLELKIPHGADWLTLRAVIPAFLTYMLSFAFLGIYWNSGFASLPTAVYGGVLLFAAIAYQILYATLVAAQGPNSTLATAVGGDSKGKLSIILYVAAIPLAFVNRWISIGIYVFVALMWLIPDPRIESRLNP